LINDLKEIWKQVKSISEKKMSREGQVWGGTASAKVLR